MASSPRQVDGASASPRVRIVPLAMLRALVAVRGASVARRLPTLDVESTPQASSMVVRGDAVCKGEDEMVRVGRVGI